MLKTLLFTAALSVGATAVLADSHANPAIDGAIKARQAHMQLYGHNLGILGGMAQGKMDYDADAAASAAANLAALAQLSQASYWPAGSDSGAAENSRALPDIWENFADVGAKAGALVDAAVAMEAVAGGGLEGLQAAMGALGGACGGCHKAYRQAQ